MPRIRMTDASARARLKSRVVGVDARGPYRDALAIVRADGVLEVRPEGSETMRGLKVNVSRASREINLGITYGETVDGALLVWPRTDSPRRGGRRRSDG